MKRIDDQYTDRPMSRGLKRYHRAKDNGLCVQCGGSRGESPILMCAKCVVKRKKMRKRKGKTDDHIREERNSHRDDTSGGILVTGETIPQSAGSEGEGDIEGVLGGN